eukprot:jgi/Undpi1/13631/HiC_scaffold_9.g03285.m1
MGADATAPPSTGTMVGAPTLPSEQSVRKGGCMTMEATAVSPSTIFYVEEASAGGGGEGPPLPPSVETLAADVITASKEAEAGTIESGGSAPACQRCCPFPVGAAVLVDLGRHAAAFPSS